MSGKKRWSRYRLPDPDGTLYSIPSQPFSSEHKHEGILGPPDYHEKSHHYTSRHIDSVQSWQGFWSSEVFLGIKKKKPWTAATSISLTHCSITAFQALCRELFLLLNKRKKNTPHHHDKREQECNPNYYHRHVSPGLYHCQDDWHVPDSSNCHSHTGEISGIRTWKKQQQD